MLYFLLFEISCAFILSIVWNPGSQLKEDLVKVQKGSYNVQEVRAAALREEIKYLGLFTSENRSFFDKIKIVDTLSEEWWAYATWSN